MSQENDLESLVSHGKTLAKRLFGLDIPVKIDDEATTFEAERYDFKEDIGYIHMRFFEKLGNECENVDLKKITEHTVCHEIGHAYDARHVAQASIFPYVVKISDRSMVTIDSNHLRVNQ